MSVSAGAGLMFGMGLLNYAIAQNAAYVLGRLVFERLRESPLNYSARARHAIGVNDHLHTFCTLEMLDRRAKIEGRDVFFFGAETYFAQEIKMHHIISLSLIEALETVRRFRTKSRPGEAGGARRGLISKDRPY